jgi:hypothetical protein
MNRSYSELRQFHTFEERYEYLQLRGAVGASTFGFHRFINQGFYASAQWKRVRQQVIARDEGCDLGIEGFEIFDSITIHHMNPMTEEAIVEGRVDILDPEFLISTTHKTHNAIHYGDKSLLAVPLVERQSGDTQLW